MPFWSLISLAENIISSVDAYKESAVVSPRDKLSDLESCEAQTLIDADCSTVWDIITDEGNYTVWPSGILRIQGEVRHGCTIKIRTTTGGRRTFRLRVCQVPGTVMTWTGGIPLGLFTCVRSFTVTTRDGMAHLQVKEEFSGPLRRLICKNVPDLAPTFTDFVNAVKARAEIFPRSSYGHDTRSEAIRQSPNGMRPASPTRYRSQSQ